MGYGPALCESEETLAMCSCNREPEQDDAQEVWERELTMRAQAAQRDPLSLPAMLEAAEAAEEDFCDCGGELKLPGYDVGRDCL